MRTKSIINEKWFQDLSLEEKQNTSIIYNPYICAIEVIRNGKCINVSTSQRNGVFSSVISSLESPKPETEVNDHTLSVRIRNNNESSLKELYLAIIREKIASDICLYNELSKQLGDEDRLTCEEVVEGLMKSAQPMIFAQTKQTTMAFC